mmetsp:Transcript_37378/g.89691  ORF Transcript_37378/g.89691 Transcript_37378/m.89691 type:complete len:224 (+) Transcript_37378:789-1460(+)
MRLPYSSRQMSRHSRSPEEKPSPLHECRALPESVQCTGLISAAATTTGMVRTRLGPPPLGGRWVTRSSNSPASTSEGEVCSSSSKAWPKTTRSGGSRARAASAAAASSFSFMPFLEEEGSSGSGTMSRGAALVMTSCHEKVAGAASAAAEASLPKRSRGASLKVSSPPALTVTTAPLLARGEVTARSHVLASMGPATMSTSSSLTMTSLSESTQVKVPAFSMR